MRLVLVALVLVVAAGCGSSKDDAPKTIEVKGVAHIDNASIARQQAGADGNASVACSIQSRPPVGGANVVITDSKGEKIAVAKLSGSGATDPYDGLPAGVPGTCNLSFWVEVPERSGVYTATIEGFGDSASFTSDQADNVIIELRSLS